jgi:hypothetical protein
VKVDYTFYRKYDAQLGRFTGIDIRAEESYGMSVYNYGANNPVLYNDPMGDKFGLEKGPDGNYHTDWVTRMMWNDWGFYQEMGQVPMMNYGNGGPYGVYYNAHGVSSTTILSMLSFGEQLQQRLNGDLGFFSSSSRGMYFLNNRNNQDNYNGNRVDRMDEGVLNAPKFININDLGGMNTSFNLQTINSSLNNIGNLESVFAGIQIAMIENRISLPISSKIGTFSNFRNMYRVLGYGSKLTGYAGTASTVVSLITDHNDPTISNERFAYRTAGAVTSIGVSALIGAEFGGPYGALAGTTVSSNAWAAEVCYDESVSWLEQTSTYINNIQNSISSGWYPSFR